VTSITAVQPLHVSAWIEQQTHEHAAPTAKLRLMALRHLFDWLVTGQVMPTNPAGIWHRDHDAGRLTRPTRETISFPECPPFCVGGWPRSDWNGGRDQIVTGGRDALESAKRNNPALFLGFSRLYRIRPKGARGISARCDGGPIPPVERFWRTIKYEEVVCCERFVSA
jgi:hypothetical protein